LFISLTRCFSDKKKTFQKEIAVKADTLYFDNSKDTLVTGSKGTALFFPKQAFLLPDGTEPKGPISIVLKECLSISDMLRENLTTMSANRLLETRGMVYVSALSNNQELQLKKGKTFVIHFPKDTSENGKRMNLFYGESSKEGSVNWRLDSQSILKPTAVIAGTGWSYACDTNEEEDFFSFRDDTSKNVFTYFSESFDNGKLTLGDKLLKKYYLFSFTKSANGELTNKKIIEVAQPYYGAASVKNPEIDPYVIQFFNSIPALNPIFCKDRKVKTEGDIRINFGYVPDYKNKEEYNRLFNQKYASFKNSTVKTVNDAELNYYVFSCSKLGWINCDYFWETPDEKIDYIVKVDPSVKSDVKLVFQNAKSIMAGSLEGDKCLFRNVPINQAVKVVAIKYKGNHPLLAVSETKTSKQPFVNLQYRDFALTDLEKQLNTP
jgi:hypothetical protein